MPEDASVVAVDGSEVVSGCLASERETEDRENSKGVPGKRQAHLKQSDSVKRKYKRVVHCHQEAFSPPVCHVKKSDSQHSIWFLMDANSRGQLIDERSGG
jgi:hypothetical protein